MTERHATILERAIIRAMQSELDRATVSWLLAEATVNILSHEEWTEGVLPAKPALVGSEDKPYLALFTHTDQIGQLSEGMHSYEIKGFNFLPSLPPQVGIAINPGRPVSHTIEADEAHEFIRFLLGD